MTNHHLTSSRNDRIEARRMNLLTQPIDEIKLYKKEPSPAPGFFSNSHSPTIYYFRRLFGSFAAPSPAAMSAAKTKAQSLIDENAVVVFSKSYCPYCTSSKGLLSSLDAKFTTVELDQIGKYHECRCGGASECPILFRRNLRRAGWVKVFDDCIGDLNLNPCLLLTPALSAMR